MEFVQLPEMISAAVKSLTVHVYILHSMTLLALGLLLIILKK